MRGDLLEVAGLLAPIVFLVAFVVVVVVAVLVGGADCPKGKHTDVVGWTPIATGKVTTVSPVYGCVPDAPH